MKSMYACAPGRTARRAGPRRLVTSAPKRAFHRITAPRSIWYTLTVMNRRPMFDRALATASRNCRNKQTVGKK